MSRVSHVSTTSNGKVIRTQICNIIECNFTINNIDRAASDVSEDVCNEITTPLQRRTLMIMMHVVQWKVHSTTNSCDVVNVTKAHLISRYIFFWFD